MIYSPQDYKLPSSCLINSPTVQHVCASGEPSLGHLDLTSPPVNTYHSGGARMHCATCLLEWDGRVATECPKCCAKGNKGKGGKEYKVVKLKTRDDGAIYFDIRERTKSELDAVEEEEFIGNVSLHDLEDPTEEDPSKGEHSSVQHVLGSFMGKLEVTLSKMGVALEKLTVGGNGAQDGVQNGGHATGSKAPPGQVPTVPAHDAQVPPVSVNNSPVSTNPPVSTSSSNVPVIDPGVHSAGGSPTNVGTGQGHIYAPAGYMNFPPAHHMFPGRQFPTPRSAIFPGGYGQPPRYGGSARWNRPSLPHAGAGYMQGHQPQHDHAFMGSTNHDSSQQQPGGAQGGAYSHPLHQQYQQYQQQFAQPSHHDSPYQSAYPPPGDFSYTGGCCGGRQETLLSKFDYRRYLPASERKKALVITSVEELWDFHNNLLRDLLMWGEDVTGFVEHMNYMSEMAKSGVYNVGALVAYDAVMLERAHNWGVDAFQGADTHLTNTKLGVGGTKGGPAQSRSVGKGGAKQSQGKWGGSGSARGSSNSKALVGWRKVAADKGLCFRFSQNMVCEGCAFKHLCVNCDVSSHSMFDCPKKGDNRST